MTKRTDRATRRIAASACAIYDAFVDPDAQVRWLPPSGMTGAFERFEPRARGRYRLKLTYDEAGHGKTDATSDIVEGVFLELAPGERIVQTADFVSDDPAFAGTMTLTWTFAPCGDGTVVAVAADDVPPGIDADVHVAALADTLANLAAFVE